MLIHSDPILTALTKKAHAYAHDRSRHLLCRSCRVRTKLYSLNDGRKKCSACGKKFHPEKKTDAAHLKQYADILLCFCIDFTAQQASVLSGYRYKLVASLYDGLRSLLARQNLQAESVERLAAADSYDHSFLDARREGSPVFGMKLSPEKGVIIQPLFKLESADPPSRTELAGFICNGKFQRFEGGGRGKDGAEQVWAWMSERLKRHHGIWKRHIGLYLKELEWKYNHRRLTSEEQALEIASLMPDNFLSARKSE